MQGFQYNLVTEGHNELKDFNLREFKKSYISKSQIEAMLMAFFMLRAF